MREEKLSDAIVYDKLHLLKKDFSGYIERNTVKVDANLPVFFGYVISALENSFPNIADEVHDDFVDSITYKVLDTSGNINDFDFIKRVMVNAIRFKKRKECRGWHQYCRRTQTSQERGLYPCPRFPEKICIPRYEDWVSQ